MKWGNKRARKGKSQDEKLRLEIAEAHLGTVALGGQPPRLSPVWRAPPPAVRQVGAPVGRLTGEGAGPTTQATVPRCTRDRRSASGKQRHRQGRTRWWQSNGACGATRPTVAVRVIFPGEIPKSRQREELLNQRFPDVRENVCGGFHRLRRFASWHWPCLFHLVSINQFTGAIPGR